MPEKPPIFTVTDRRKFTPEGELRDEAAAAAQEQSAKPEAAKPEAKPHPVSEPSKGPKVVSMPTPKSEPEVAAKQAHAPEEPEEKPGEEEAVPAVSAQDEAAAHRAYQQSSDRIETMMRAANPAAGAPPVVSFEHVVQSIYLSAVVALGAATEPGQKPQIDIMGARQSIDMLGVLQEKTKGNLSEKEQRLLQNALFESRMMFLEITNALAQQGQRPPQGKK